MTRRTRVRGAVTGDDRLRRTRHLTSTPTRQEARVSVNPEWSDIPRGQVVASYDTYAEAQRAVDWLSDQEFPVQHIAIVGSDLRMVESVTGRLTRGRAALAGAGSGAWFGLFVGVLLSFFSKDANVVGLIIAGLLYGAVFGAIFGFVSHALTGGRRDFTSRSKIVSSRYDVMSVWAHADAARAILERIGERDQRT
jgi:hypothetical protein